MFGLGAGELFVIFALALILIGPKKLPELARGLGKAIREFQNTKNDLLQEVNKPSDNDKNLETSQAADDQSQKSEHPIS
ncbi:MAG: twin-arginine translocase TatA/TatE family subunit [Bdellovibrionales bacterium]|jgi:sec-independent protein translocase protein TatA|nr:twin-arginine translocase TatA/TatE family subunit [Bdellovibrionales bacterium]